MPPSPQQRPSDVPMPVSQARETGARVVEDVACLGCGCLCDDLVVSIRDNTITDVTGACRLAPDWRDIAPGGSLPTNETYAEAAAMLADARAPLIYIPRATASEAHRQAVLLADAIGGLVDGTSSRATGAGLRAVQQIGQSTCTLGEVANRADLVIYWRADPLATHPRHWQRYAVDPRGQFVPGGRADRRVVVVDTHPTATSAAADLFVQIEPDADFETLWTLLAAVHALEQDERADAASGPLDQLAEWMVGCRTGAVFYGPDLEQGPTGHRQVEALLRLVRDLNRDVRFYAQAMNGPAGHTVSTWITGYPFGVKLARGYPRYNGCEHAAETLLARGEVDACLLVGAPDEADLSSAAWQRLRSIPTILLDIPARDAGISPRVRFDVAAYGIQREGTGYRMDGVAIPLRRLVDSSLPSAAEVLQELRRRQTTVATAGGA